MTKTSTLKHIPKHDDIDEVFGETDDLRRAADELAGTRVSTLLAMAALQDRLTRRQRDRIARRSGTAMVVQVPGPAWCDPMERALNQGFLFGWVCNRRGAPRPAKSASGDEAVSDHLAAGLNVAGVSHDVRFLPSALVTGADITIEIGAPSDRVVRTAIALATGRECRRLPPGVVAGLTLDEIAVAIRRGSTPAQCRKRLAATAAAKSAPDPALADVPPISALHGYEGEPMAWALALKCQVDDWRAGKIARFDQIADRAVCLASAPGLGKTIFARALARELGLPIIETSVAAWFAVGGAGHLGDIVQQAEAVWDRAAAIGGPVVVLLDELDGLPSRSTMSNRNRDFWAPLIHSVLLALDGSGSGKTRNCVLVGATNHREHLDDALIRPGRLNRVITIHPPGAPALAGILRQHLGDDLSGVDLLPLATLAAGSTGAQAAGWVRTARAAARAAKRPLRLADLLDLVAEPDTRSPEDRLAVARHEAAHAAALLALGVADIDHVTVVPRGRFAGRTCSRLLRPDTRTRREVEDHVVAILAGRAADETWGMPTTGSGGSDGSDLSTATALVAALHATWCLAGSLIHRAPSPARAVDLMLADPGLRDAVETDLHALYARALVFVRENKAAIDRLARRIVADGVVGGETVREVLADAAGDGPEAPHNRARTSSGGGPGGRKPGPEGPDGPQTRPASPMRNT